MQTITKPASVFSSIRISLVSRDTLRAMASCLVGGAVMVTGLRVIEGKNGLFVAMPSRKNAQGEYQDIAFPISKEIREELQKVVLEEFEKVALSQAAAAA